MPDPHVISALEDKAHELRQAIVSYEEHLDRTRHELAVVTATLTIMARDGHPARHAELVKGAVARIVPTLSGVVE